MTTLFIKFFNMSITAGWLILAVLSLRIIFRKAPKAIRVVLWSLVGLRLVLPFSLESVLSLVPSTQTISIRPASDFAPAIPGSSPLTFSSEGVRPVINSGFHFINDAVNPVISKSMTPEASVDPIQVFLSVLSIVWLTVMIALLLYAVFTYARLRRKVSPALRLKENIWISDHVDTPFILGLIRPRIFLPFRMLDAEVEYVIAHEQAHIKRRDHLWKPLGFLLLTVY